MHGIAAHVAATVERVLMPLTVSHSLAPSCLLNVMRRIHALAVCGCASELAETAYTMLRFAAWHHVRVPPAAQYMSMGDHGGLPCVM